MNAVEDSSAVDQPSRDPTRPRSFYFGVAPTRQLGWYYAPVGENRGTAFLLCPPFGYEAMCVHRSYRKLAERLCAAGYPVLRFDLPGANDSEGDAGHPGLVAAWLAAITLAREELEALSGAQAVVFFGLRLGATLAAQAAARGGGVHALALFAPFASGAEFLREARAFRLLKGEGPAPDGGEEIAGYPLSKEACADLRSIDLKKLAAAPAPHALLMGRDDLEEAFALAGPLGARGCAVETSRAPGYASMMRDAYDSHVPEAAFDALLAWAARLPSARARPQVPRAPNGKAALDGGRVVEEVVRFGDGGRLVGVLATPSAGAPAGRPAVVFLNTGANHHVGPNRMYVEFSRALAAQGWSALRFDVSGIGDSPPAPAGEENDIYSAQALEDTRQALDLLAAKGLGRAVLVGLCSGAYVAFHSAADPRVAGVVLINQQTFHWKKGDSLAIAMRSSIKSQSYYKKALFDAATWRRLVRAQIDVRHLSRAFATRARAWVVRQGRALWSLCTQGEWEHSDVARGFRAFSQRGGEALLVFGELDGGRDVIEEHLGPGARKMQGRPGFSVALVQGTDHTFTPVGAQRALFEVLRGHLERSIGAQAPQAAPLRGASSSPPASPPPSAPPPSAW